MICYGDSITAQAWPDELMLRLLREGKKAYFRYTPSCERYQNSPPV
ncbi:MAG: hypothetical protein ACLVCH_11980 [Roseburia inulinivorans]